MSVDPRSFREALARFASGVCVVTGRDRRDRPVGLTISSFSSLSLDPPLVLFCIDCKANTLDALANGAVFAVNVLGERHHRLSERFATQDEDKFGDAAFEIGANGCRLLTGCLAHLECTRTVTFDGGDHKIVVGRVDRVAVGTDGGPLLYFRRRYWQLGAIA